jgi:hypothetical protein
MRRDNVRAIVKAIDDLVARRFSTTKSRLGGVSRQSDRRPRRASLLDDRIVSVVSRATAKAAQPATPVAIVVATSHPQQPCRLRSARRTR